MLELEKWGKGKPEFLVMFAHGVALAADDTCEICVMSRNREFRERFARIENKRAWIANYRRQSFLTADPRLVAAFVGATEGADDADTIEDILVGVRDFQNMTPKQRSKLAREVAEDFRKAGLGVTELFALGADFDCAIKEIYRQHLIELKNVLKKPASAHNDIAVEFVTSDTRFRFFILVVIPCWLEHGRSVDEIYRSARSGDFDSLCILLNLDPLALEDREIRKQFEVHLENSNDYRRKKLYTSLKGKPIKKLRRRKIKLLLAALVYKIFERVDLAGAAFRKRLWKAEANRVKVRRYKLTFPQVHELFDAAYADSHKDAVGDVDLEVSDEVFKKGVQRALPFWPDFA